jgi:hypothetical protein
MFDGVGVWGWGWGWWGWVGARLVNVPLRDQTSSWPASRPTKGSPVGAIFKERHPKLEPTSPSTMRGRKRWSTTRPFSPGGSNLMFDDVYGGGGGGGAGGVVISSHSAKPAGLEIRVQFSAKSNKDCPLGSGLV